MYLAKFDSTGERITSYVEGIHFTTDEEKQKCIEEDCIHITTEPNGAMWFKKPR